MKTILGFAFLSASVIFGQSTPNPILDSQRLNQLCTRVTQLMDAAGIAVPEMQRASAPLVENVRQSCIALAANSTAGRSSYGLLMNVRAFLDLSDAVPKPYPFPEEAHRQINELRDDLVRLDAHFRALLDTKDAQLRTADRDNLARYAEANSKLGAASASKPRVVFMGDSITDFWRLNEYFPDRDFVNRGISGQITSQMLDRMKADVIDLNPKAVVILGGTNDLARSIPLTAIENNYVMMADLASLYKIKVIFASVLPVSDYHKDANPSYERTPGRPPVFIKALNDWLQRLCADRGYVYLDYFSSLQDNAGLLQADAADDGLHPNAKGYRIMAPLVLAAIDKSIKVAPVPTTEQQKDRKKRQTGSEK